MAEKKKSLRWLSGRRTDFDEIEGVFAELAGTSDRAAAIVMTAVVETELQECLCQYLDAEDDLRERLVGRDGPINSFSAGIILAEALSVVDKETSEALNTIRKIRNAFAHAQRAISFDTEEIAEACDVFKNPVIIEKLKVYGVPEDHLKDFTTRQWFTESSHAIHRELMNFGLEAVEKRMEQIKAKIEQASAKRKAAEAEMLAEAELAAKRG